SIRRRKREDLRHRTRHNHARLQSLAVRGVHKRLQRIPQRSVPLPHQERRHPSKWRVLRLSQVLLSRAFPRTPYDDSWQSWLTDMVQGEPKFDDQAGQWIDTETSDVVDHNRALQRLRSLLELESNPGTSA